MDSFTRGYIDCALWCGLSDDGGPDPVLDDLAPEARAQLEADARDFQATHAALLEAALPAVGSYGELGHLFWLTRNHHGAGFWDRGLGSVGDELTRMAHAYGSAYLYRGDDGRVYLA